METGIDEEKNVEYVTPTGEIMGDDKLDESDDESQSSMAEIEAIRSQMMAVQVQAQSNKINTNINNNRRDSEEMGVQLALISAEKDEIEKNKANLLNANNSNRKDQFGLVLNDSKVAADMVEDDILNDMENEKNNVTPGGDYVTPGRNSTNNVHNIAGEGGESYFE